MSAAEKLKALKRGHQRVIPVFRKTGPRHEGADAFSRARDIEIVMDALPQIRALVEAAEQTESLLDMSTDEEIWAQGRILRAALTSLDEVLGT